MTAGAVPPLPGPELPGDEPWDDVPVWPEPDDDGLAGSADDPFTGVPAAMAGWLDGLSGPELADWYDELDSQPVAADPVADWFAVGDPDGDGRDVPVGVSAFSCGEPADRLGPGPLLAELSHQAFDHGMGALSDDALVGLLRASRRLAAWQDGVELAAVAELDARRLAAAERPASSRASEHVAEELAMALVLTGRSADMLLGLARGLARLAVVTAALIDGAIDRPRAVVFVEELAGLDDQSARTVAEAFAGRAGSLTTGQLRRKLRAMVLLIDPDAVRKRAAKARGDARVEAWQELSGNGALAGRELPVADMVAADARITAIAQALKSAGAAGTLDQVRAAVFCALLTGRDPETLVPAAAPASGGGSFPTLPGGEGGPGGNGRGPGLGALAGSVHLTLPAATWLGWANNPGEVPGYGPVDAWTARDLAGRLAANPATRWQATLTSPDGRAVAHARPRTGPPRTGPPRTGPPGRAGPVTRWLAGLEFDWLETAPCTHRRMTTAYRPGNLLRTLVTVRNRTCGAPGCRRPARQCDVDHTKPWEDGGLTCECNLAPLCRRHHRAKQAPGWHVTQSEPGTLVWTAPHRRTYTSTPEPYLA